MRESWNFYEDSDIVNFINISRMRWMGDVERSRGKDPAKKLVYSIQRRGAGEEKLENQSFGPIRWKKFSQEKKKLNINKWKTLA